MKVILCTHNSGGVGKTTLAVHLAGVLSKKGDVLLIDCDDQADSWKFYVGAENDFHYSITTFLVNTPSRSV